MCDSNDIYIVGEGMRGGAWREHAVGDSELDERRDSHAAAVRV